MIEAHMLRDFEEALLSIDRFAARGLLLQHQEKGNPLQLVEGVVVPALERIGTGWEAGEVALSQVYMAGRICEELMDELFPEGQAGRSHPEMAVAVLEDHHMLGKRLVHSVLRSGGFQPADYGHMTVEGLVDRVKRDGIQILLISTLMLPSALNVKKVREGLQKAGMDVKIIVGGAPFRFDESLWKEVGADATSSTASGAVDLVHRMLGELE